MYASLVDDGPRVLDAKPSPTAGSFGGQRSPAKSLFRVTKTKHWTETEGESRTANRGPVAPVSADKPVPAATARWPVPDASGRDHAQIRQGHPSSEGLSRRPAEGSTRSREDSEPQILSENRCRQQPSAGPRAAAMSSKWRFKRCPNVLTSRARRLQTRRKGVLRGSPARTPFHERRSTEGAEACPVPSTTTDVAPAHLACVRSSTSGQRRVPTHASSRRVGNSFPTDSRRVSGARNSRQYRGADNSPVPVQTVRSTLLKRWPSLPGAGDRVAGSGPDRELVIFPAIRRDRVAPVVAEAYRWRACGKGRFEAEFVPSFPSRCRRQPVREVPTLAQNPGAPCVLGGQNRRMDWCRRTPPFPVPFATHFPGALNSLRSRCR
jgi:hypothetical protein